MSNGEAWTLEAKEQARAMRGGGKTYRQIADALGCTRERVNRFFWWRDPSRSLKRFHQPTAAKWRDCLRCGVRFLSKWIGNRLCLRCSVKADSEDCAAAV